MFNMNNCYKKLAKCIVRRCFELSARPVCLLDSRYIKGAKKKAIKLWIEGINGKYRKKEIVKYAIFDNDIEDVHSISTRNDIAILLTGIMYYEKGKNYTLETCCYYRKLYPNISIVLSTWNTEVTEEILAVCKKYNIKLECNEEPERPGRGHINNQIFSSQKGVVKILNLGIKWTLKMRTDQRILKKDFLDYFIDMEACFPIKKDALGLAARLIVLGTYNSFRYYPFWISDFFVFGRTVDVQTLYSVPFDYEDISLNAERRKNAYVDRVKKIEHELTFPQRYFSEDEQKDMIRVGSAEVYLYSKFAKMLFCEQDGRSQIELYHSLLKDCFFVVDEVSICFDWPKDQNVRNQVMTEGCRMGNLDFLYWLHLESLGLR